MLAQEVPGAPLLVHCCPAALPPNFSLRQVIQDFVSEISKPWCVEVEEPIAHLVVAAQALTNLLARPLKGMYNFLSLKLSWQGIKSKDSSFQFSQLQGKSQVILFFIFFPHQSR